MPLRALTGSLLVLGLLSGLQAQTHVTSPADLNSAMIAATTMRQHNLETIKGLLASSEAEKVFAATGINPAQVTTAVSALDDHELTRLAVRAEAAQADFAAGRISDRDLLLIVVGIAVLVLVIVAVR
jgi:hypothetical protein